MIFFARAGVDDVAWQVVGQYGGRTLEERASVGWLPWSDDISLYMKRSYR